MKRILWMIFSNILIFPYLYIKLVILVKGDKYTKEQKYLHLRRIMKYANRGGRVNVECHGIEHLPSENGYILYPNHQGMYDVLTIIATNEVPFSVVIKKELKDIFMLSRVFEAMGALALDREDIRQSMGVIKEVGQQVSEGNNFLIFAEGTRSKQGNKVGEFKGGSFKAAYKAKCPIVPVALVDAYVPFDIPSIKKVTVTVEYLEAIPYEEYKGMKTTELAMLVQNRIQDAINARIADREEIQVN